MATVSVYQPSGGTPDELLLAKEGPSFFALALPPVFLAWNRLWLALAAYLCIEVLFVILARTGSSSLSAVLSFLPGLFLFVHGRELVRNRLERQGWREIAVVSGDTEADAEIRFFNAGEAPAAAPENSAIAEIDPKPVAAILPSRPGPRPLGIFPE